jgi:hypothetical protein
MVWAYPAYKESEMKRIDALQGMRWLRLLLVFQTSYTAAGAAEEVNPSPDAALDYWTGRIEQDTTWRDTVYVGGDVTIASGATLTLAPDTQVRFLPYRDDAQGGLDSTRAELIVEGRLNAQAAASPTSPTRRYETVFAACMPIGAGASGWTMALLPTVGS